MYQSYENYNETSEFYDSYRRPVAVDLIKNHIKKTCDSLNIGLKDCKLLDVGCGTGNYISVLKDYVGSITGIEYNDGMLNKSKQKFEKDENVTLIQGSAFELPFKNEEFHIVIMNQVFHHLDGNNVEKEFFDNDFPKCQLVTNEIFRVLKKKGRFLNNVLLSSNIIGMWFVIHLMPQNIIRFRKVSPSKKCIIQILKNSGFSDYEVEGIEEPLIDSKYYFDSKLVKTKQFRDCSSLWSLLNEKELEKALERYDELVDEIGIDNFNSLIKEEIRLAKQSNEVVAIKN